MNYSEMQLVDVVNIKTGKLNSNAAVEKGEYPFYTCAPSPLRIDKYKYNQAAILLAGNNAEGNFHINYFEGKFEAYQRTYIIDSKNEEKYDLKYLFYALKECLHELKLMSQGTSTKFLTMAILNGFKLNIPDINEQRKIAGILSSLDQKISNNEAINRNLADQVSAIYKSWFVDFELYDGVCPDTWKTATLGDLAEISSGKRPPMKQTDKTDDVTIPLVGAASIMGYTNEVLYDSKILVTGRVGTHGVIQRFNEKCWPSDNTLVITTARYEFVYQILQGIDYTSMNRGSTQPLITQGDLKKTEIIIPTVDVLDKFEVLAGGLMEQYEKNRVENINLAELRDTLLPKLMSGELDVSEIDL